MKWFADYVNELKEKLEITSDYGMAQHLGIARQSMTKIKNGDVLNSEMCFRIANELKRHPMEIIATARAQKERNAEFRAFWIKMAKEYGNK